MRNLTFGVLRLFLIGNWYPDFSLSSFPVRSRANNRKEDNPVNNVQSRFIFTFYKDCYMLRWTEINGGFLIGFIKGLH